MRRKRIDLKAILADADLRRDLMVSTIQATQAREGIETSEEQAGRAYYVVTEADKAAFFDLERFREGGGYCRFFSDIDIVVHWDPERRTFPHFFGRKGRDTARPESLDDFFKPGLTWPLRTQRGFNLRVMPSGCIFGHKGPGIFPTQEENTLFVLGLGNSATAEYLLKGLTSFGSWEVGVIKRLPVPRTTSKQRDRVGRLAQQIHDAKATWDEGNETSTRFKQPWLLLGDLGALAIEP